MIKGILETNEGKTLLLGLSRANCEELLKGRPITFDNEALPLVGINRILVMGGETEAAMAKELAEALATKPPAPEGEG